MLVLATLFWGMGFSWAKNVGDAINRAADLPVTEALGPIMGLALRFGVASLLWVACVPDARRHWTWRTAWHGVAVGGMLAVGLILQHIGLGLSDEAVIAFLTNLTVVFVPAWVVLATRKRSRTAVLVAVPVALLGTVLLVGVRSVGPMAGVGWGVACAAAFAAEILMLDRLGRGHSAARITLLLLATSAILCGTIALALPGFGDIRWHELGRRAFLADALPLTLLTTVVAFALMVRYQPRVDPTRAAVLYLCEPLFAAAFAWLHNGRSMGGDAVAGAALILSANVIAEWKPRRV